MKKKKYLKIIDINWFTGWVWKEEYMEKLKSGNIYSSLKNNDSISFLEKEAFWKVIPNF